jgi:hypothetical protein
MEEATRIETRLVSQGREDHMNTAVATTPAFELEIQIEELEPKVAPDGGETVLPLLPTGKHHK